MTAPVTFVNNNLVNAAVASGTTLTVTRPSTGLADGDLLVVVIAHFANNGTFSVPSGWTAVYNNAPAYAVDQADTTNLAAYLVAWKTITTIATEPSTYSFTVPTSGGAYWYECTAWRGHNTTTPIGLLGPHAADHVSNGGSAYTGVNVNPGYGFLMAGQTLYTYYGFGAGTVTANGLGTPTSTASGSFTSISNGATSAFGSAYYNNSASDKTIGAITSSGATIGTALRSPVFLSFTINPTTIYEYVTVGGAAADVAASRTTPTGCNSARVEAISGGSSVASGANAKAGGPSGGHQAASYSGLIAGTDIIYTNAGGGVAANTTTSSTSWFQKNTNSSSGAWTCTTNSTATSSDGGVNLSVGNAGAAGTAGQAGGGSRGGSAGSASAGMDGTAGVAGGAGASATAGHAAISGLGAGAGYGGLGGAGGGGAATAGYWPGGGSGGGGSSSGVNAAGAPGYVRALFWQTLTPSMVPAQPFREFLPHLVR